MYYNDLTIIYYTANKIDDHFAKRVRAQLKKAAGDFPIISVSKKTINFGENICVGETEQSIVNIYKAVLIGAKAAKTKYVAMAEDDTLYSAEHFERYRPPPDTFGYNQSRWSLFSWTKPPFFNLYPRMIMSTMIAPRDLLIRALTERFAKFPDETKIPERWMAEPGRQDYEKALGVTPQKAASFYTYVPTIVIYHPDALGFKTLGTRKRANEIRAYEIPDWGRAEDVINSFYYGKPVSQPLYKYDKLLNRKISNSMNPTKGIVFYTDHRYNMKKATTVQRTLAAISRQKGIPIVSASLKPMSFGNKNVYFPSYKVGPQYLYKQILAGLQHLKTDIAYICAPDVLYNPTHFDLTPEKKKTFYYNANVENEKTKQISALFGYKDNLIKYFESLAKKPVATPRPPLVMKLLKSDLPIQKV